MGMLRIEESTPARKMYDSLPSGGRQNGRIKWMQIWRNLKSLTGAVMSSTATASEGLSTWPRPTTGCSANVITMNMGPSQIYRRLDRI